MSKFKGDSCLKRSRCMCPDVRLMEMMKAVTDVKTVLKFAWISSATSGAMSAKQACWRAARRAAFSCFSCSSSVLVSGTAFDSPDEAGTACLQFCTDSLLMSGSQPDASGSCPVLAQTSEQHPAIHESTAVGVVEVLTAVVLLRCHIHGTEGCHSGVLGRGIPHRPRAFLVYSRPLLGLCVDHCPV